VLNHLVKKEEVDQEIVIKGHFPSPETNVDVQQYFQQDKVFQSCLSSLENDVVVLFLSGLDMDGDSETTSMETPSSEKTLVKEYFSSVLAPEKETFFQMIHDPKTHYMERVYNQNLQIIVDCKLKDKESNESMSVSNMILFTPDDVLQPWLPYDSRNSYYQTSQQTCQFLNRSQQVKSPENKNAVEGVKHDSCFVHVLEYPFAVLLEEVNSPGAFDFLIIGLMDEILNELSAKKLWNKQVQRK
jgi:hypothetical protein